MAFDWLVAVLLVNQMPGWKISVSNMDFATEIS